MGDRTYTSIEFTGEISEAQADELVVLLKDQGCESNGSAGSGEDDLLAALKDGDSFYDSECNYATMEEIEAWCKDNEVGYLKTWEPGGGFGPGIEIWVPGMAAPEQCASVESSPVATFNELEKAYKEGTVADLIKDLDKFNNLGPPIQVLAVNDWTPELCVRMAKRALEVDA